MSRCSLCGGEILDRRDSRFCVYCNSTFHRSCIIEHFFHNKYCPVCKEKMSFLFMRYGSPSKPAIDEKPSAKKVGTTITPSTNDLIPARPSKDADFTEELDSSISGKNMTIKSKTKKRPSELIIIVIPWLFLALLELFLSAIEIWSPPWQSFDVFSLIFFLSANFATFLLIIACYGLWRGIVGSLNAAIISTTLCFGYPATLLSSLEVDRISLYLGLFMVLLLLTPWAYLIKLEVREYFFSLWKS